MTTKPSVTMQTRIGHPGRCWSSWWRHHRHDDAEVETCSVAVIVTVAAGCGRARTRQIAERLRAAAAEPFAIDGRSISLTAAVGIGTSQTVGPAATDAAALLRQPDPHMYEQTRRQPPSRRPPRPLTRRRRAEMARLR